MSDSENKTRAQKAALDRLLGLSTASDEDSPAGSGAYFERLERLKDDSGLTSEARELGWEEILRKRAYASASVSEKKVRAGRTGIPLAARYIFAGSFLTILISLGVIFYNTPRELPGIVGLPARAASVNGRVLVNGKLLRPGARIGYEDILEVGENGGADLIVDGKNIFRLYPGSRLRYLARKGDGLLALERGGLAAVVKNKRNAGRFRIAAPETEVIVKGTSFVMEAVYRKLYICICNGRINVRGPNGAPRDYQARHHAHVEFDLKKKSKFLDSKFRKRRLRGHGDRPLEEMAAKIGVKIKWK